MCAGASYWTQLKKVVFGANDERPRQQVIDKKQLFHPKTEIMGGIMGEDCKDLLQLFFEERREG